MILNRLLARPAKLARKIPGVTISQTPGVLFADNRSSAGVAVDQESALSLSAIFAGVNLLSSIIGTLPLSVYAKSGRSREVAANEPAHGILHTQLNPEMTASVGRRTMEFHRLLWGNEYAEIQWLGGGDRPYAVWPIEPWRVRPDRDRDGTLFYLVDGTRRVDVADMIHVPLLSADGVVGRSFVDYAIGSLGLGIASQEFAAKFFGNGARPGGLLTHAGQPTADARKKLRDDWVANHGGAENANKVGVLWGGWSFDATAGSISPHDSQLLESRRFQTEEVARWLNIPPHLLRDLSRATFSNIEHQGIDFVTYSLSPPLVCKEQEYDRKLLGAAGAQRQLYCKHNLTALLRGDSASRSAFYREMFGIGVLNQNTILELEDMNPIGPLGDVRYVPMNIQPIEQANAPKPPSEPPAGPPPPNSPVQTPAPDPSPTAPDLSPTAGRRLLLADVFDRLGRKEANEARRAAKNPARFLAWMDGFYPAFEGTLATALRPVAAVCGGDPEAAAANYCQASRAGLLLAAETSPADLARSVDQWCNNRPAAEAGNLLGGPTDAEVSS
jgi:HK97 family phage portal protein